MSKKYLLSSLLNRLKELGENCEFNFVTDDYKEIELEFASLKKMVPDGLYYVAEAELINDFQFEKNCVIITNKFIDTNHLIISHSNPQLLFYRLASSYEKKNIPVIEKSVVLSDKAKIGINVSIGHYCVIGNCEIGNNVIIRNNVVIEDNVIIGDNTLIDSNSVIGASGLAWIWDENGNRILLPQIGGVNVGSNCILATDVTIVKGSLTENTTIGDYTVIAHGTKIGHGCQVGHHVHIANNVSLAGNAVVGDRSFLGSACIIAPSIKLPNNSILGAGAMLNKSFEEPFCTFAGIPAKIIKKENFKEKPNGAPKPYFKNN